MRDAVGILAQELLDVDHLRSHEGGFSACSAVVVAPRIGAGDLVGLREFGQPCTHGADFEVEGSADLVRGQRTTGGG